MILRYTLLHLTAAVVLLLSIFGLPVSKSYADVKVENSLSRILIIHSWGKDHSWSLQVEKGLKAKLKAEDYNSKLFFAHLDTRNFSKDHQRDEMARHIQEKFKDTNFDIVMTVGLPATSFIKRRSELFPNAKKILVSTGAKGSGSADAPSAHTIAIDVQAQYENSFKEMLRLKNPQSVYIVADTLSPGGTKRIESFKSATRMQLGGIDIHYLLNLPMNELLKTVSNLPDDSALFYLLIFQDGNKIAIDSVKALQMLSDSANSPVFTNWEVLVGSGTIGGYLVSGERVGKIIADRILKGMSAEIQAPAEANPYGYYYDWRQLKRWNIDENSLPPGATIMFRELTAFEKYRWEIVSSLFVIFLFIALSATLIVINRKRSIAVTALIDERLRLEETVSERTESLSKAKKIAEHHSKAKSEFLSSMSHELRTPLNAILGFSQLLDMNEEDDSKKQNIREIIDGGNHLLELINEVLDLSKIESGKADLSIDSHNLVELFHSCFSMIKSVADKSSIQMVDKISPSCSNVSILVDGMRFKQVLLNLLSNAIKYNKENGEVIIDCKPTEGNKIYLSITDTGKGLTLEQQSCIFEPFDRVGAENSSIEGIGLGLAISKDLIELMDGSIGVESEVGKGSCFWIKVPLA